MYLFLIISIIIIVSINGQVKKSVHMNIEFSGNIDININFDNKNNDKDIGSMYICGGYNGSNYLSDCYKYNKHSIDWQSIQSMSTTRQSFGLVSMDSRLYAIGGYNSTTIETVETYDFHTNIWDGISSMNLPRYAFGSAVVNNKIYVCGGYNDEILKSCEYYSTNTDEWYFITPMGSERSEFELVSIGEGFLYAIGGYNRNGYLNSMNRFDIKSKQWTRKANMISKRSKFGSVSFMGKIYVCGGLGNSDGKTCEKYDPQTNHWTPIASMNDKRFNFKMVSIGDNLFALGGYSGDKGRLDSVEIYDRYSDKWFYTQSLPQTIDSFGATTVN
ncbi:kelch-like protein 18 [Oppia nitens]|uniref:kelch-like protein 18 n=1 Tax=Oppia nitens TaxID=1686743 RepID=UPI0023DB5F15|nr:kelch-like protein 18 [Oppia nitens]